MNKERFKEVQKLHEEAYAKDTRLTQHPEGFEWMPLDHTPHVDEVKQALGTEFDEYLEIAFTGQGLVLDK